MSSQDNNINSTDSPSETYSEDPLAFRNDTYRYATLAGDELLFLIMEDSLEMARYPIPDELESKFRETWEMMKDRDYFDVEWYFGESRHLEEEAYENAKCEIYYIMIVFEQYRFLGVEFIHRCLEDGIDENDFGSYNIKCLFEDLNII